MPVTFLMLSTHSALGSVSVSQYADLCFELPEHCKILVTLRWLLTSIINLPLFEIENISLPGLNAFSLKTNDSKTFLHLHKAMEFSVCFQNALSHLLSLQGLTQNSLEFLLLFQ